MKRARKSGMSGVFSVYSEGIGRSEIRSYLPSDREVTVK
jgi:hypothetical protein